MQIKSSWRTEPAARRQTFRAAQRLPETQNSCIIGKRRKTKDARGYGLAVGSEIEGYPSSAAIVFAGRGLANILQKAQNSRPKSDAAKNGFTGSGSPADLVFFQSIGFVHETGGNPMIGVSDRRMKQDRTERFFLLRSKECLTSLRNESQLIR